MTYQLSISIVIYNESQETINKITNNIFDNKLTIKLFIIDNSDKKNNTKFNKDIEYIYNNKNLGFGKAHNIALKKVINNSEFHLILNSDIKFSDTLLVDMYNYMKSNPQIGSLVPKTYLFDKKTIQYCGSLLPTPKDKFFRNFLSSSNITKQLNYKLNLEFASNKTFNIPCSMGYFMFIRNSLISEIGFFDERFFLYVEDIDYSRRISEISNIEYNPNFIIYHEARRGSKYKIKLLINHIVSIIKYFNKWGWFIDKKRKSINKKTISSLK